MRWKTVLSERGLEVYWRNFTGLSDDDTNFDNDKSDDDFALQVDDNDDTEIEDYRNTVGSGVLEESEDEEDNLPPNVSKEISALEWLLQFFNYFFSNEFITKIV